MKTARLLCFASVALAPYLSLACKQDAAPEPGVSSSTPQAASTSAAPKGDQAGLPPATATTNPVATASAAPSGSATMSTTSAAPSGSASATTASSAGPSLQKTAAQLDPALAKDKAPDVFKAKFITSKGNFTVEVHKDWSPNGADRFYNLVKLGYYNECRFFRVVDGFMVQFGINGDPAVNKKWQNNVFPDDKPSQSNTKGMLSFATRGKDTRTTQVFINFVDNSRLDGMGFTPFGKVVDGMSVVESLYKGYGEGAPRGQGPDQQRIQDEGNTYLKKDFDKMDWVKEAKIVP